MNLNHELKVAEDYTPGELSEGVDALHKFDLQGMIRMQSRSFVLSLIGQHQKKGTLSPKQAYYVFKIMREAMGIGEVEAEAEKPKQRPVIFNAVFAMFEEAAKHLKKPSVVFPAVVELDHGYGKADLKVYPGYKGDNLNVIVRGNGHGRKVAWVNANGELNWKYNHNLTEPQQSAIFSLLKELAQDPSGTVAKYGKLANRCCFCSKELTDEKSVTVGYGPVCATHYGLPWGKTN